MGHSSRSSSTLKKPFQTFKSFIPIQHTTRTGRMKFLMPILLISLAALCNAGDGGAAVARTAAIDMARDGMDEVAEEAEEPVAEEAEEPVDESDEEVSDESVCGELEEALANGATVTVEQADVAGDAEARTLRYYYRTRCYYKTKYVRMKSRY